MDLLTSLNVNGVKKRMLDLLIDGQPHHPTQLIDCVQNSEATAGNMYFHLCNLRKILRPVGYDILIQKIGGRMHHRLVRLLSSPYDGRK